MAQEVKRGSGHRRTLAERERDLAITADLYCKGYTQVRIAQVVGVSNVQIFRDIETIHRRWLVDAKISTEDAVNRELQKINRLEMEAWEAWTRSREPKELQTTERTDLPPVMVTGPDGRTTPVQAQRNRVAIQRQQRDGDPRFFTTVQWCIERRCKLLGLDAPEKVDITLKIRERAIAEGLDPDRAVAAAERILAEQKQGVR